MAVQEPHRELIAVADALDRAVSKCLAVAWPPELRAMAPIEAIVMSWNVARNVQAVSVLARTDEILVPAAWSNTRAALETGIRILWLLRPDDPVERELRVIPLLKEYAKYHDNMANRNAPFSYSDRHRDAAKEIRENLARFQIPNGKVVPALPKVESMLKELANEHLYAGYIEASQYSHGTMAASAAYRRASRVFAEKINLREWLLPVRLCWITLRTAADAISFRVFGEPLEWDETVKLTDAVIKALAAADPSS